MSLDSERPVWTKPYYGIQHLGELADLRRASVTNLGSCTVATFWLRGQGFSAPQATFESLPAAQAACEAWVGAGVIPPSVSSTGSRA